MLEHSARSLSRNSASPVSFVDSVKQFQLRWLPEIPEPYKPEKILGLLCGNQPQSSAFGPMQSFTFSQQLDSLLVMENLVIEQEPSNALTRPQRVKLYGARLTCGCQLESDCTQNSHGLKREEVQESQLAEFS